MSFSFDRSVSVPEHVLVQDISGELVLLNLQQECYYGLNNVGTRMWQVITDAPSLESAVQTLLAEYDVAEDELRRDLADLITHLSENDLVVLRDAQAA